MAAVELPTLRSGASAASSENGASASSAKAENAGTAQAGAGKDSEGEQADGEKADTAENSCGFFTPNDSIGLLECEDRAAL